VARTGAVLADCGGGRGPHVEPFRESGWRIHPLAMPAGGVLPELVEPPSLVLMPHTLERMADPLPALKALRRQMPPDGLLAVATADLLAPKTHAREAQPWLADSHLRLYSFNSVQCLLARAGFKAESVRRIAGTGIVAVLARLDEYGPEPVHDDAVALQQLYGALRKPGSADTLGDNLAGLAETQPGVLPLLCRRLDRSRYTIRRSGHCLVAVLGRSGELPTDEEQPIVHWGDLDGYVAVPDGGSHRTLVQLGLGSGELATALAESLRADQHLFIWEADAALARTVLEVVDLSPLWLSSQVSLLLGLHPYRTEEQRLRLHEPSLVYSTRSARQWNTWGYRDIISRIGPGEALDHDEGAEIVEEPRLLLG
jgi:hypothetical protein